MPRFTKLTVNKAVKAKWGMHKIQWADCVKCEIGALAHKHVCARGEIPCDVLFLGEGPGVSEDIVGLPFIGESGRLLDVWIEHANEVRTHRWDVETQATVPDEPFSYAITNIVACRPCNFTAGPNRPPEDEEIRNCNPRLAQFMRIADPKMVVLLGRYAADNRPTKQLTGLPVIELIHPSACLRGGGRNGSASIDARIQLAHFIKANL